MVVFGRRDNRLTVWWRMHLLECAREATAPRRLGIEGIAVGGWYGTPISNGAPHPRYDPHSGGGLALSLDAAALEARPAIFSGGDAASRNLTFPSRLPM